MTHQSDCPYCATIEEIEEIEEEEEPKPNSPLVLLTGPSDRAWCEFLDVLSGRGGSP